MGQSVLRDKSFAFALQIVAASQDLQSNKKYVLSRQILRSGTSIGALVREAEFAQSKSDFMNKLSIALKESNETEYWILLLKESKLVTQELSKQLLNACKEIIAILVSSIKTAKASLDRKYEQGLKL